MTFARSRRGVARAALALATMACSAHAAPEPASRALELGYEGLELYERGDTTAALARFRAAEQLAHSPVFLLYIARSQARLGQLVDAKRQYQTLIDEPLRPGAPESWRQAREAARVELEPVQRRIASVQIAISTDFTPPLQLRAASRVWSISSRTERVELDPGPHTLVLSDGEGQSRSQTVVLREGEHRRLAFDFRPRPTRAETTGPARSPRGSAPSADGAGAQHLRPAGRVALGLGAGALAFGAVAGVVALVQTDAIKDNCVGDRCLTTDRGRADTARTWANLATVGLGVGAVGVGTGLALLLWQPERQKHGLTVHAGPGRLEISGEF